MQHMPCSVLGGDGIAQLCEHSDVRPPGGRFYGVGQLLARETYWADVADEAAPIPCTYC